MRKCRDGSGWKARPTRIGPAGSGWTGSAGVPATGPRPRSTAFVEHHRWARVRPPCPMQGLAVGCAEIIIVRCVGPLPPFPRWSHLPCERRSSSDCRSCSPPRRPAPISRSRRTPRGWRSGLASDWSGTGRPSGRVMIGSARRTPAGTSRPARRSSWPRGCSPSTSTRRSGPRMSMSRRRRRSTPAAMTR